VTRTPGNFAVSAAAAGSSRSSAASRDTRWHSHPVAMTAIDLRMPDDDRARQVALALLANPADKRALAEWGREAGASERTLARGFLAGTGIPFGRWRTLLRLQAALPALAAGDPVSAVARRAGYDTASAFVAAFRRETGLTPVAYFR
jgi:AraC-like DNA-binding protein